MTNKFLRLLIVVTKLTTAEKMQLDKFLQQGEYLAYRFSISPVDQKTLASKSVSDLIFEFWCEIDQSTYHFTNQTIGGKVFSAFEIHLSKFLNVLFERKRTFETDTEMLETVIGKLQCDLTREEIQLFASHIDTNPKGILRLMGVVG